MKIASASESPRRIAVKTGLCVLLMLAGMQSVAGGLVIELDDVSVTREALDNRFAVALQLLALRQGISLADQDATVIESLRQQYLDKHATELVLLREAERRQISFPESVVEEAIAASFPGPQDKVLFLEQLPVPPAMGQELLHEIVRDEKLIELLTEHMLQEIKIAPGDVITLHHDIKDTLATPEEVCVRHIQTSSAEEADAVMTAIESGEKFADLARSRSTDKASAAMGGDIGCFARGAAGVRSEFERVAFAAEEGKLSGPVESQLGFHVLVVYEHKMPRAPTLNEAYAQVERELALEKLPQKIQNIIESSGVRINAEN